MLSNLKNGNETKPENLNERDDADSKAETKEAANVADKADPKANEDGESRR